MKTSNSRTDSQKLAGAVLKARLRVTVAEKQWKTAKEQVWVAKRKRKEVKIIARRAKKLAKQAKDDLAEARRVLAKVEAKLVRAGVRVAASKPVKTKARSVGKRAITNPKKKAAPFRERHLLQTASYTSVIGKSDSGTPESAVISGDTAETAIRTTSIPESGNTTG